MSDSDEVQNVPEDKAGLIELKTNASNHLNVNAPSSRMNPDLFHLFIKNSNLGFVCIQLVHSREQTMDLIFLETNPAFEHLLGLLQVTGQKLSEQNLEIQAEFANLFPLLSQVDNDKNSRQAEFFWKSLNLWLDIKITSLPQGQMAVLFEDINARKQAEKKLREKEERYRTILENASQGIALINEKGMIIEWNPAMEKLTGTTRNEAIGQPAWEIQYLQIPVKNRLNYSSETLKQKLLDMLVSGNTFGMERPSERTIETPSGESKVILQHVMLINSNQGFHLISFATDITEFKRVENEMRDSGEKLRLIFENAFDGINIYEEFPLEGKRTLLDCNERYCQMSGRSREELFSVANTQTFQVSIENAPEEEDYRSVLAELPYSGVFSWLRPDGRENVIEYNAAPRKVGDRYFTIGLDRDITERKQLHDKLREQATTDDLTGLSNRRHFIEIATLEIIRAERLNHPVSLALFDIDYFKQINDTYGHAAGDQALKLLSKICRENVRILDVFARFGGDEFALLMPETDSYQALNGISRFQQTLLSTPMQISEHEVQITVSVGIATFKGGEPGMDLDTLLKNADKALYQAKQAGRNRIVFDHSF